jgi:hypothetical protein
MWTYLDWNEEWGYSDAQLPPEESIYLAFDTLRGRVVLGYRERGGYSSMLEPNVVDDCHVAAWAPLSEPSDPDLSRIKGWDGVAMYRDDGKPTLVRGHEQP